MATVTSNTLILDTNLYAYVSFLSNRTNCIDKLMEAIEQTDGDLETLHTNLQWKYECNMFLLSMWWMSGDCKCHQYFEFDRNAFDNYAAKL